MKNLFFAMMVLAVIGGGSPAAQAMNEPRSADVVVSSEEFAPQYRDATPEQTQAILGFIIAAILFHPAGKAAVSEVINRVTEHKSAVPDGCGKWRLNPGYNNLFLTLKAMKETGQNDLIRDSCKALKKGLSEFTSVIKIPFVDVAALSEEMVKCACEAVGEK